MFYNARLSVLNILLDMSRVPNECLYGCFASVSPLLDKVHVWDWSVWGTWCIYVIHEGLWCPHINCLWAFIGVYRNLDLTNYFWASFLNAFKNSNIMCDEEIGAPVDMRMWWGIRLQLHKHSVVMWYTWPGALTPYGIPFELLLPHRYLDHLNYASCLWCSFPKGHQRLGMHKTVCLFSSPMAEKNWVIIHAGSGNTWLPQPLGSNTKYMYIVPVIQAVVYETLYWYSSIQCNQTPWCNCQHFFSFCFLNQFHRVVVKFYLTYMSAKVITTKL